MHIGNWRVETEGDLGLDFVNDSAGVALRGCVPRVQFDGKEPVAAERRLFVKAHQDGMSAVFEFPDRGLVALFIVTTPDGENLMLCGNFMNGSQASIALGDIAPLAIERIESPVSFDRCWTHGPNTGDRAATYPPRSPSSLCAGFANSLGDTALILGFVDLGRDETAIEFDFSEGAISNARAVFRREGIALAPGDSADDLGDFVDFPDLFIGAGTSLSDLLDEYAALTAERMNARRAPALAGWCSWYYYYGTDTQDDIDANVEAIFRSAFRELFQVIQIDDGWNLPQPGARRVWGDWFPGAKFPKGMRHAADRIKEAGFMPGLWLAPFTVEPSSRLFAQHPDWMIQDESGPLNRHGVHALDLTRDDVLVFLRETFERVFDEWGFEYVKLDFMLHAMWDGKRRDATMTKVEAYRRGLGAIREVAGERYILGCNAPLGPSIGLVDAMRIGSDVSSRWFLPTDLEKNPDGGLCIRSAAANTIGRQWMHGHWWSNDPDCLVLRDYAPAPEKQLFGHHSGGEFANSPPYGLTDDEAEFWARLVWMSGGLALVSENMTEFGGARSKLMQRGFPPNPDPARLVDWYEDPAVSILRSDGEVTIVGMFNTGDETVSISLPPSKLKLGAGWHMREMWSGEEFSGDGDTVEFPPLSGRAGRLWVVDP